MNLQMHELISNTRFDNVLMSMIEPLDRIIDNRAQFIYLLIMFIKVFAQFISEKQLFDLSAQIQQTRQLI